MAEEDPEKKEQDPEKKEQDDADDKEDKIPDYYLAEFEEAFSILDDENTKMITTRKLWDLLRMLGTPGEIDDHIELLGKYDPDRTGMLDYKSCLEIMTEKWKNLESYDELKEAFMRLDPDDTGFIRDKDLRTIMTTCGNPLNKQEINKFMKCVLPNAKGFIIWDDYLNVLKRNV